MVITRESDLFFQYLIIIIIMSIDIFVFLFAAALLLSFISIKIVC